DPSVIFVTMFLSICSQSSSRKISPLYSLMCLIRRQPGFTLFPYTTLFRSDRKAERNDYRTALINREQAARAIADKEDQIKIEVRSEEHTSELQSQSNLVCRLLLEKKKTHRFVVFSLAFHYNNILPTLLHDP